MRVGIIGCGAIGGSVLKQVVLKYIDRLQIFIYDKDSKKTAEIRDSLPEVNIKKSLNSIVKFCDFVIETASIACVRELLPILMSSPRDVLFMSVGGLLGKEKILNKIRLSGKKVIIPSGAIGGIDAIKTLSRWGIKKLLLKTFKPGEVLMQSPYITKNKIKIKNLQKPQLIFKGSVKQAIKAFPRSINVSATLLIYSGLKDFEVQIYASPEKDKITHIIEVVSNISTLTITCQNFPSPHNPRTSNLAIASACMEVEDYLREKLQI
jgi:aspartate dehydrogenase